MKVSAKCRVKPGVLRKFLSGTLNLEEVAEKEDTCFQFGKINPMDKFEAVADISDGDLSLSVLLDRQQHGYDIFENKLVCEHNIIRVKKTSGNISERNLKLVTYKTPANIQLKTAKQIGDPDPWCPGPEVTAYRPRGRFSDSKFIKL